MPVVVLGVVEHADETGVDDDVMVVDTVKEALVLVEGVVVDE